MSLRAASIPYTDEDGLALEKPNRSDGPETGNGIRELCVREYLCLKRGETNADHVANFVKIIDSCQATELIPPKPVHGLYMRGPRKLADHSAHDDRRCLSAISSLLNLPYARHIHDYGKANWWCYDNLNPRRINIRLCDRRFLGVVPSYRIQSGNPYLPLEDVELAAAIFASAISKNPRQKIIWLLTIESLRGRLANLDEVIMRWDQCLKVQYPEGLPGVFAAYYETWDHPNVQYSRF